MSAVGAKLGSILQWLLAAGERRLPALTRLRAAETLPIRLHRRRIYVLPTAFGIGFGVLIVIMQLGALNYANNAALLLTCILAAAAWMSLFAGFRTLAGLELVSVNAAECHAGNSLSLTLHFRASARPRPSLRLRIGSAISAFALAAGESPSLTINLATNSRGWMRPGRMKLWTEQPFGLFTIWSWLNPQTSILVYPSIEEPAPPLPHGGGQHGERFSAGDGDEFSGLREYRSGDPQRRIAWKASARHDGLLVRESEVLVDDNRILRYSDLHGLDHESRIRRLAAWVIAADAAMLSCSLELPGQRIGSGLGQSHRTACLRALALLPDAP
jgi:uncharacterized protein (DUF58 family)